MSRLIADFSSLDCADNDIEVSWDDVSFDNFLDPPLSEKLGLSRPDNGLVRIPLSVAVREFSFVADVAYYNENTKRLSVPIEHGISCMMTDCYVLHNVEKEDIASGSALDTLAVMQHNDVVLTLDDIHGDRHPSAMPVSQARLGTPVSVLGDAYGAFPSANDKWMRAYEEHEERMEKEQQEAEDAYQRCLIKEREEYMASQSPRPKG